MRLLLHARRLIVFFMLLVFISSFTPLHSRTAWNVTAKQLAVLTQLSPDGSNFGGESFTIFDYASAQITVTASNLTPWSFDLTFGSEDAVNLVVSTTTEATPSNPTNAVDTKSGLTTNPYTVSDLSPGVIYHVYVQVDSDEDWSYTSVTTPTTCPIPTNVSYNPNTGILSWDELGMTSWNIKISTTALSSPGSDIGDILNDGVATGDPEFTPTCLMANSTYYCYIQVNCEEGELGDWASYVLTTSYCAATSSLVDGTGITNVTFGTMQTVNNTTGLETGNYGNYSNMAGAVLGGETFTVSVTYGTDAAYDTRIWIDWDNDYQFDEVTEIVHQSKAVNNAGSYIVSASITVHDSVAPGSYRMRIRGQDSGYLKACAKVGQLSRSCCEDYTVLVLPEGATCAPPMNIAISDIMSSSATVSWDDPSSADGYGIYYSEDCTSPNENTPVMVTASELTKDINGLSSLTTYYVWLRANCGSGHSIWYGPAVFTTQPPCPEPVDVSYDSNTGLLSWSAPGTNSWNIKISTTALSNPDTEFGNVINDGTATGTPQFTPECLLGNNTYHFYVQTRCGDGDLSDWAHHSYTLSYCVATGISVLGTGITNVTFGTEQVVNNTTGKEDATGYYGDYSDKVGAVLAGDTFDVSVTLGTTSEYAVRIWVDWNNDFEFDEITEKMHESVATGSSGNFSVSASIPVPSNMTPGSYRMRIRGNSSMYGAPTSCTATSSMVQNYFACCEDYTVLVLPEGSDCVPPTNMTISDVTYESAIVSWEASSSTGDYEIYYSDECSSPDESTSGQITTSELTEEMDGLSPLTTYYVWLRTECEDGYSIWYGPTIFSTLSSCVNPTDIMVSNITTSSADFTWTGAANATSFEIEVGLPDFVPGGGSAIYDATVETESCGIPEETLEEGKAYVFAVRSICGDNDGGSEWTTFDFGTAAEEVYGQESWNGYVYKSAQPDVPANRFGVYLGMVTEPAEFSRNKAEGLAWSGVTEAWAGAAPTSYYAVRYRMAYDFSCGNYAFKMTGVDDAVRLSVDGGATWLETCYGNDCAPGIHWNSTAYKSGTYTASAYLDGPANLVLEFFNATGAAGIKFDFEETPINMTVDIASDSFNVTFLDGEKWNIVVTSSQQADPDDPTGVVIESYQTTLNPFPVSGLTPETQYYVYTQLSCGGPWGEKIVTTVPACPVPTGLATTHIGADTATLVWDALGMTSWKLKVSTTALEDLENDTADVFSQIINTNRYKITLPNPITKYFWYVQANCGSAGNSVWSDEMSFKTTQIPAELPYTCDFESPATNSGWEFNNGTQTNQWVNGTAVSRTGTGSMYISNDNGVSNAYSNATSYVYAYRTVRIPATTNQIEFAFDWKCQGVLHYSLGRAFLVPLTANIDAGEANGMSSYNNNTPNGWIDLGDGNLFGDSTWKTKSKLINAPEPGNYNIVFFWKNSQFNPPPPIAIDNVSMMEYSCPVVTNLQTSNITAFTADVAWQAGGDEEEWEVKWCESNVDPGTVTATTQSSRSYPLSDLSAATEYTVYVRALCDGQNDVSRWGSVSFTTLVTCPAVTNIHTTSIGTNSADLAWTAGGAEEIWSVKIVPANADHSTYTEAVVTETSYVVTTLSDGTLLKPSTKYDCWIQANCEEDDNSVWTKYSFTTECGTITVPFKENFDNTATSTDAVIKVPDCWAGMSNANKGPYVTYAGGAAYYHSAPNYLDFNWPGADAYSLAVLPEMDESIAINTLKVTFYGRAGSDTIAGTFTVGVMSDLSDADTYIPVDTIAKTDTMIQHSVNFENYTENGRYIAFKWDGGVKNSYYLDDVEVDYAVLLVCNPPTGLSIANIEKNSADVSWTQSATAVTYTLEYKKSTDENYNTPITGITTASYPLTGLEAGTQYNVRVKSVCLGGDESGYTSVNSFVTLKNDTITYTIEASAGSNGSINPSGSVTVAEGD
ncbi:fibronectin type III domain-containing protein, partial [Bacteroidales bacterium OttesenSCG-928-A14]|nr:fibronectin type III domain-containing protein [Bacteroidales bacterium OttesenSCG-928-A14]